MVRLPIISNTQSTVKQPGINEKEYLSFSDRVTKYSLYLTVETLRLSTGNSTQ